MVLIKNAILNNEILDILILNGKIIEIGKISYRQLKCIFNDIKVIDASGMHIIPSYIDNHVHIIGGGGELGYTSRIPEINVEDIIKYGVTTIIGVLGTDSITKSMENLIAKTKALNNEGITAYCLTGGYEFPAPTLTGRIQKDIVFINEILGTKIAISDHRCYNPTKEELIKLISETRVAGLLSNKPGIINIHLGYGKGKMDIINEIINQTNIPIQNLLPTHVTKTGDLINQAIDFTNINGFVDVTANGNIDDIAEKLNYIAKHGNKKNITISSDANGSCPIWENGICKDIKVSNMNGIHELIIKLITKYNYSLEEAISFATLNPAKVFKLNNKGIIKAGYDADLLFLDNEYDIKSVISKGRVLKGIKNG